MEPAGSAGPHSRTGMMRGTILAESLRPGTVLDVAGMQIICLSRYQVSGEAAYQPAIWTAIEFEAPEEIAPELAGKLAAVLLEPGWYVNWNSHDEATVVFPSKVFRYRHGDLAAREAAQAYGRSCGVPEPQLDWTE